uniref:Site-specific recombinase, DNA invertase Pin n=1 Tax=Desulfovibrio sp. U5L TaxID=596152 RepID=I2PZ21_9BACT
MPLKFACLARVSTEAQEKKGESLDTQETQLRNAVRSVGGELFKLYRGQEHATSGQDRSLLDQLLSDGEKHLFDAVMVADHSRWSRDNRRSKDDLELLRRCRIRFFILTQEFDLYNYDHNFMLGMQGEIAEYYANTQSYKAMINKIERAKKGYPSSCGAQKVPFGRTFDKKTGQWGIDPEKQSLIREIVRLILDEDWTCMKAALHFGIRVATLNKQIKRIGSTWVQRFHSDRLNIHEEIVTKIPGLVPDDVAEQVKAKVSSYNSYNRGPQKHFYLFSRKVIDAGTGETLTGKTTISRGKEYKYYRPWFGAKAVDYQIPSHILEEAVLNELFMVLSGKAQMKAAVFEGKSTAEAIAEIQQRRDLHVAELDRAVHKLSNLRAALAHFSGDNFETFLEGLSKDIGKTESIITEHRKQITQIDKQLSSIPTDQEINNVRNHVNEMIAKRAKPNNPPKDTPLRANLKEGLAGATAESWFSAGNAFKELPDLEKKKIINMLFGGKDPLGRRYGIYIKCLDKAKRRYHYEAYGRFMRLMGEINDREYDGTNLDDYAPRHAPTDEEQGILGKVGEIVRRQHPDLKIKELVSTADPKS